MTSLCYTRSEDLRDFKIALARSWDNEIARQSCDLMVALAHSREDWLSSRALRDLVTSARSRDCRAKL